jgi:ATP-binding cassette subfamily B multidrug efflux pump
MFRWFENIVDPFQDYDDADTPPSRVVPFVWSYLRTFRKILLVALFLSALSAAIEMFLIFYAGRLIDVMVETGAETFLANHWVELMWICLFIVFFQPAVYIVDRLLMNQSIIPNVGTMVRWRAHRHVLRQSVGWFEDDFAGRIANRIVQVPPAIGAVVFQTFDAATYSVIYMIAAIVLLADIDLRLAIPLVVWLVIYGGLLLYFIPRVGRASKISSDARSNFTGRVVDSYTNIQSVKLFSHHNRELNYARDAIEETRNRFFSEMRIYSFMGFCLILLNSGLMLAIIGFSIFLWTEGQASIGVVAATTALALRLTAMTDWIMWALSNLFQELGIVSEGMQTIAQPIHLLDDKNASDLAISDGKISLKDVRHHYGKDRGGLNGVSIDIKGGEKVGIVGRSGAGKSTLVNLILRFHDTEEGAITIDGQNICDVTQDSLRSKIGMVTQDSSLLHRSVRDNILYGRPDAGEEAMIEAAERAEAHTFIPDLSDMEGKTGYDAHVGERGVKLSGGQRQRIAIARVILKNAPILILDEATSALDSEVEAAIQSTLYGVMEGKTVIAIAHRLSTIAKMDRIVVLDGGVVAEQGSHSELLALDRLYAGFWKRQSGGFIGIESQ